MGIIQQKETKEMEGEGREAKERARERKASNKKRKRNSHPLSFSQTLDTTKSKFQSYDTYVLSDPVGWAKGWGALAADVAADDAMRKRVMFDLMNEPDARGIGWATVRICFLHFFPVFVNNQKTAGARLKALVSLSEERESESFFRSSERQRQRVFFFFFALLPEKEANKKLTFSLSLSPFSLPLSRARAPATMERPPFSSWPWRRSTRSTPPVSSSSRGPGSRRRCLGETALPPTHGSSARASRRLRFSKP